MSDLFSYDSVSDTIKCEESEFSTKEQVNHDHVLRLVSVKNETGSQNNMIYLEILNNSGELLAAYNIGTGNNISKIEKKAINSSDLLIFETQVKSPKGKTISTYKYRVTINYTNDGNIKSVNSVGLVMSVQQVS